MLNKSDKRLIGAQTPIPPSERASVEERVDGIALRCDITALRGNIMSSTSVERSRERSDETRVFDNTLVIDTLTGRERFEFKSTDDPVILQSSHGRLCTVFVADPSSPTKTSLTPLPLAIYDEQEAKFHILDPKFENLTPIPPLAHLLPIVAFVFFFLALVSPLPGPIFFISGCGVGILSAFTYFHFESKGWSKLKNKALSAIQRWRPGSWGQLSSTLPAPLAHEATAIPATLTSEELRGKVESIISDLSKVISSGGESAAKAKDILDNRLRPTLTAIETLPPGGMDVKLRDGRTAAQVLTENLEMLSQMTDQITENDMNSALSDLMVENRFLKEKI